MSKSYILSFSSADAAFPEITICPSMRRYAYKWDKLCDQYGLCNQKEFKAGNVFPINSSSSECTISDYYNDITYDLDDLITKFEVFTKKPSTLTNDRYHLKYILLMAIYIYI